MPSRYTLGAPLGHGGMGLVRRAHDEVLGRDVAVKVITPPLSGDDPEAVQRHTLREARAAAQLSHPGVVQVFDVLSVGDDTWIVMEYVPSRSLQEVIAADGPLDPAFVGQIGLELLDALIAADRAGVEHRDVKPANVLLADDGRVLLTDFGIATLTGDSLVTSSDVLLGSPEYMSPERARGGHVGLASDLWSLGATLFAAVEGESPFHRPTVTATLTALATEPPDPATHAGALGPALAALLQKDPAKRPSASATRRLLTKAAAGAEVEVEETVAAAATDLPVREKQARQPVPAGRWGWLAAAVVVLLAVGAGVVWLVNRPSTDNTAATLPPSVAPASSAATTTSPSASPSASPSSSPSPSPSASSSTSSGGQSGGLPELPSGWRDYHDPTGFSLYVPNGWTRSKEGSIVYFRSAGRVLGIDQSDQPKSNPVADWQGQASYRVGRGDFPSYHQIHIQSVDYFVKAADWEFTYVRGGVRQHVNNRGFVVNSHQAYGIYWQTADSDWARYRSQLDLVFDSFRPRS